MNDSGAPPAAPPAPARGGAAESFEFAYRVEKRGLGELLRVTLSSSGDATVSGAQRPGGAVRASAQQVALIRSLIARGAFARLQAVPDPAAEFKTELALTHRGATQTWRFEAVGSLPQEIMPGVEVMRWLAQKTDPPPPPLAACPKRPGPREDFTLAYRFQLLGVVPGMITRVTVDAAGGIVIAQAAGAADPRFEVRKRATATPAQLKDVRAALEAFDLGAVGETEPRGEGMRHELTLTTPQGSCTRSFARLPPEIQRVHQVVRGLIDALGGKRSSRSELLEFP